nr:hypothetical protein [Rhodococcus pyridinivorans]
MNVTDNDQDAVLERRAEQLREEAQQVLAATRVLDLLADVGEAHLVGSAVSDLMSHREIDITVAAGPDFGPSDALRLCEALAERSEVRRTSVVDERTDTSVAERDRRVHVTVTVLRDTVEWELDISLFALDAHRNVADWHEELRASLTPEQRRAILRIKNDLHDSPDYPGGLEIYNAVCDHGVRNTNGFLRLTARPVVRGYRDEDAAATLEIFIRAILQGLGSATPPSRRRRGWARRFARPRGIGSDGPPTPWSPNWTAMSSASPT